MHKTYCFWFFFTLFLLPAGLLAQQIYNGHVWDAGSGEAIPQAHVKSLSTGLEVFSNAYGDFSLKTSGSPYTGNTYDFYYNSLVWEGEQHISLQLYTINGQLTLERMLTGNEGSFVFPRLPQGIYILRIHTNKDEQVFKVFSDGHKTYAADRNAFTRQRQPLAFAGYDTLEITAPGYYPRRIVLPRKDTIIQIGMLRGDYAELDYFNELIDPIAYELLSSSPARTNVGGIKAVKIIYNLRDGQMYYMNTKAFQYHFTFAAEILGFRGGNSLFNQTQYRENPDRYLLPANLNYYEKLDKYVLQLVAINEMNCEHLKLLYDKLLETSYFGDKLVFFSNKPEWDNCEGIATISSEELYEGQNYQALNLEENYGYLTKVKLEDLESTYLGRHDIVLLNGIPNDVSVVAGIITTEFQTPLSHINVLSNSRGTPNMALRDAWENEKLNALLGELVYLKVGADSFEMRKASVEEATAFWSQHEPQNPVILSKNTSLSGLVDLTTANHSYVDRIGGKAANFAELLKIKLENTPVPVPESSFAIPFYYYQQHIESAGLDVFINEMLADPEFQANPAIRRQMLLQLQDRIQLHPIDPVLEAAVKQQINYFADFPSFRFRSSTNAEDLEFFSGAGLYDSYSAKKNYIRKTVGAAIKKVWASLWNWRAFEERSYFKIDHESCAMGILVHRSFPDEDANGVLVTKNLYNENPGFIINVQYKEYSIVFPEPGILNDQIMLFAWSNVPGQYFSPEYLSFSNVPELNGKRVMTDEELFLLGAYCLEIKSHFYEKVPHSCNCDYWDFGLDIEFKVDSDVSPRKIYIKQVRPFR